MVGRMGSLLLLETRPGILKREPPVRSPGILLAMSIFDLATYNELVLSPSTRCAGQKAA
jgi:hypothetical protein